LSDGILKAPNNIENMRASRQIQRVGEEHSQMVIQPALEVGKEDDEQEKEADAVADKVMRMPAMSGNTGDKVRKMTDPTERNVGTMHSGQPVIQKMSAQNQSGINAPASVEKGINSTKGSGQSLTPEVQEEMGSKMGTDLGNVKVHTGSNAVQMSSDIRAKAFTHGNDIYFNQGQYNPSSNEGKHLLAHELTHTVQQSGQIKPKIQRAEFKPDQKVSTKGGEWNTKQPEYRFRYKEVFDDQSGLMKSATPVGAKIELHFIPSDEIRAKATQIALIQKVITFDAHPDPKNDPIRQLDPSVYENGKIFPDEESKARAVSSGARIDKPSDSDNPIYTTESVYGSKKQEKQRNKTKQLKDTPDEDVNHADQLKQEGKSSALGHQYRNKMIPALSSDMKQISIPDPANASDALLVDESGIFSSWVHPAGQTFEVAALVVDGTEDIKG